MTKRIQTVWVCNPAARRVIALGLTKASWRERLGAIDVRLICGETPDCRHKPAGFRGFVTAYARESRRANPAAALCSKRSISFFDRNC